MSEFAVAEKFVSINGEGRKAGELAVFIRFRKCNLRCSYCDTKWANSDNAPAEMMTEQEILDYIKSTGVKNVTLTGGEPLLRENMAQLIEFLGTENLSVEIETNGSIPLKEYAEISHRPSFTMDYKLPSSEMENMMCHENFDVLSEGDTVKFVCGSKADLERAYEVINQYKLKEKTAVYLSPVFGKIEPADMVEFMKEHNLNGVRLQLQLHKFIWHPDMKGV